jgi:hypothetical protein
MVGLKQAADKKPLISAAERKNPGRAFALQLATPGHPRSLPRGGMQRKIHHLALWFRQFVARFSHTGSRVE